VEGNLAHVRKLASGGRAAYDRTLESVLPVPLRKSSPPRHAGSAVSPIKEGGKVVGIITHTLSLSVLREPVGNERVNERGCSLAGRLAGAALPEQEAGARKILSYVFIPALLIIEMHPR